MRIYRAAYAAAKPLGRPRETELRAVLDAILYIARFSGDAAKDFRPLPPCKAISTIGVTLFYDQFCSAAEAREWRAVKPAHRPG